VNDTYVEKRTQNFVIKLHNISWTARTAADPRATDWIVMFIHVFNSRFRSSQVVHHHCKEDVKGISFECAYRDVESVVSGGKD